MILRNNLERYVAGLQKRADRADQLVLFFLAGANLWEKHAKNCAILCIFVYFLVLIFLGKKLVGANFYAFCNYVTRSCFFFCF